MSQLASDTLSETLPYRGEEYNYTYVYWGNNHKVIPAGSHKVDFIVTTNPYNSNYDYGAIASVKLMEYRPLETACLKEGSMNITFENDPDYPWLTEDGYIKSMNADVKDASSIISTTITIDKISLFTYEYFNGSDSYNNTYIRINDISYESGYHTYWTYGSVVLYPGTYKIEFENSHTNSGDSRYSAIRNVCLSQDWIDVTLNQPGELSTRLIQALGDKNLQDAELVSITGSLNDTDWNTISQLTGIKAIDFR